MSKSPALISPRAAAPHRPGKNTPTPATTAVVLGMIRQFLIYALPLLNRLRFPCTRLIHFDDDHCWAESISLEYRGFLLEGNLQGVCRGSRGIAREGCQYPST